MSTNNQKVEKSMQYLRDIAVDLGACLMSKVPNTKLIVGINDGLNGKAWTIVKKMGINNAAFMTPLSDNSLNLLLVTETMSEEEAHSVCMAWWEFIKPTRKIFTWLPINDITQMTGNIPESGTADHLFAIMNHFGVSGEFTNKTFEFLKNKI